MRRILAAVALAVCLGVGAPAFAVVTTTTRTVTYSPSVPTTVFTVTFPFLAASHLTVTKTTIATSAVVTLAQDIDYTVTMPVGSTQGSITTAASVTNTHRITITRTVPYTQTTSFSTAGTFNPRSHEAALDKLTMEVQQLAGGAAGSATQSDITAAMASHTGASDPHTGYALLAGRSGGQHLKGGTASGNNLQLSSTSHATKGKILLGNAGTSAFDETNSRLGVGTASPAVALDVVGAGAFTTTLTAPTVQGGVSSAGDLTLLSTTHGTKGKIKLGTGSAFDDANERLGVGTTSPSEELHVVGEARVQLPGFAGNYLYVDWFKIYPSTGSLFLGGGPNLGTTDPMVVLNGGASTGDIEAWGNAFSVKSLTGTDLASVTTSDIKFAGLPMQWRSNFVSATIAETVAAPAMCGAIYTATIDNTVIQLPDQTAAHRGCLFTLINIAADGTVLASLSPHASDSIVGSCVGVTGAGAATVTQFSGTVDKDIRNTKATANDGDYVTVVGNGNSKWRVVGCVGEWASEP